MEMDFGEKTYYEIECVIDNPRRCCRDFDFKGREVAAPDCYGEVRGDKINDIMRETHRRCLYAALALTFADDASVGNDDMPYVGILDFPGLRIYSRDVASIDLVEVYVVKFGGNGRTHVLCRRRNVLESMIGLFRLDGEFGDVEIRELRLPDVGVKLKYREVYREVKKG